MDVEPFSAIEYGRRVGYFSVVDLFRQRQVPFAVAIDAVTAIYFPEIVDYAAELGAEFIARGVSNERPISSAMSAGGERAYVETSITAVTIATGTQPIGWASPQYSESPNTPSILAEAGMRYVLDWPNDEQPYVGRNGLWYVPPMLDLDDEYSSSPPRNTEAEQFGCDIREAFDRLALDGDTSGRIMVVNLNGHISGQPFRLLHLERSIDHIVRSGGSWVTTPRDVLHSLEIG